MTCKAAQPPKTPDKAVTVARGTAGAKLLGGPPEFA